MSTFQVRTPAQIRDDLLAYLSSRFAAIGLTIQTAQGSHAWNWASALGIIQGAIDAQAQALTAQILPDQATGSYLDRHGAVQGVPREQATESQVTFSGTGSNGTVSLGSATVQTTSGARFVPNVTSVTVSGGTYSVTCTAQLPGSAGNIPIGTICTWSTPPVGLNASLTVNSVPVEGADTELDSSFQQRILLVMQDRPASGNRADWKAWAEAVTGVTVAFIYPLFPAAAWSAGESEVAIPGTLTVCVLGPKPASIGALASYPSVGTGMFATGFSRAVSGTVLSNVAGYIEGTNDVNGVAIPATFPNTQLRPVTIEATNYGIVTPSPVTSTIAMTITNTVAYAPQSTQQFTVTGSSFGGSGSWTLTVSPAIADTALVSGVKLLLNTTGANRGNVEVVTIQTTPTQGTNSITVNNVVGTPITTGAGRLGPYAANFQDVLQSILGYIDNLGPGDVNIGAGASVLQHRWPPQDTEGRGNVYPSEIAAAVMDSQIGAPGVVDVVMTSPASPILNYNPSIFVAPTTSGNAIQITFVAES